MSRVVVVKNKDSYASVQKAMPYFSKPKQKKIVLKPNLIAEEPPPTTTPVETVEALVKYFYKHHEVIVAEGSGWCETFNAYKTLGYAELAEKYGVRFVDLNKDEFEVRKERNALFLKEFEFPLTLKNSYLISVPVLKEHSITGVTLSLKNMLGATLAEKARIAKKGRFHRKLDESMVDVNLYLKPSFAVIDGRVAGFGGELGSRPREVGVMIFSEDLVAADSIAATYLRKHPSNIKHLQLAEKQGLGTANLNEIDVIQID